jgi:hypothetical protein
MDVSSFYVNGPYLHHDPKAVPSGVEDYFTHVVEPQVKREINSNYERAKQEL